MDPTPDRDEPPEPTEATAPPAAVGGPAGEGPPPSADSALARPVAGFGGTPAFAGSKHLVREAGSGAAGLERY
ncbi:MAG: hypothetical protein ACRD0J_17995 [Acidimicrobiales bacterium]